MCINVHYEMVKWLHSRKSICYLEKRSNKVETSNNDILKQIYIEFFKKKACINKTCRNGQYMENLVDNDQNLKLHHVVMIFWRNVKKSHKVLCFHENI